MKYDYNYLYNRNTKLSISILPWKLHKWTLCGLLGIKKLNTTSLLPQCDDLVERFTHYFRINHHVEQKTTFVRYQTYYTRSAYGTI